MYTKVFDCGTAIFHRGDPANCMFKVLNGQVGIYSAYGTVNQNKLTELHPGQFFGEMGIVSRRKRSASAVAEEYGTELGVISKDDLDAMLGTGSKEYLAVMKHLNECVRFRQESYLDLCRTVKEMLKKEETSKKILSKIRLLVGIAKEFEQEKQVDPVPEKEVRRGYLTEDELTAIWNGTEEDKKRTMQELSEELRILTREYLEGCDVVAALEAVKYSGKSLDAEYKKKADEMAALAAEEI